MPLACKLCVAERGLSGADLANLPKTEEELYEHIEAAHHMPVARQNETEAEATARFLAAHPEVLTCDHCKSVGAPWTKGASA
jgi:hypothetical protein